MIAQSILASSSAETCRPNFTIFWAISRGGRYTLDNVVPACRSCNASKCNDEVTGWMRRKKLDEERFLVRQYEISRALRTGIETS